MFDKNFTSLSGMVKGTIDRIYTIYDNFSNKNNLLLTVDVNETTGRRRYDFVASDTLAKQINEKEVCGRNNVTIDFSVKKECSQLQLKATSVRLCRE